MPNITSAQQLRSGLGEVHEEVKRLRAAIDALLVEWGASDLRELMPDQFAAALVGKGMSRTGADAAAEDVRGGMTSIRRGLIDAGIKLAMTMQATIDTDEAVKVAVDKATNLNAEGFTV